MEDGVFGVCRGDTVVGVDNPQFGRVLKRVLVKTQHEEHTAERPDVTLLRDREVLVQVQHLGRAIHRGRVLLDLWGEELDEIYILFVSFLFTKKPQQDATLVFQ